MGTVLRQWSGQSGSWLPQEARSPLTTRPTMWIDSRGNWHVLSHNGAGPAPCGLNCKTALGACFRDGNPAAVGCAVHFYSAHGANWRMSPVAAYSASVEFVGGQAVIQYVNV